MRFVLFSCLFASSLLAASAAGAATYYVRVGGNDNADGRSHATAWATLGKVNKTTFATSDIVLLHEGDRFTGSLTVDWSGTSTQPAVVGAYYVNSSGGVTRGYKTSRPVIDGGNSLPGGIYDALLTVRANYVRVENIKSINSTGRNIAVTDSESTTVIGCSTDGAWGSGIHVQRSNNPRVENNVVTHAGKAFESGGNWGGVIEMDQNKGAVLRKNIVTESYGEGLNSNASKGTLIEDNYVWGVRAVGIYVDASPDVTVRRNIVVGSTNSKYWRSSSAVGAGIVLNNEKYHYECSCSNPLPSTQLTQRTKVYDNLVAYTTTGIAMWGEFSQSSFNNTLIFNNTLVDNNTQFSVQSNPKTGSLFENNILLSLSSGTRDVSGTSLDGMVAKNNYFSQGNPGGDYVHSGNRFSGLKLAKMSGWRSITTREQITWRDFDVQSGSPVIGAGTDEPRKMATSSDTFQLDYNASAHNSPMDMGGLRYGQAVAKRPSPPENLALN
jgi:parallel beta-helix repeat protein